MRCYLLVINNHAKNPSSYIIISNPVSYCTHIFFQKDFKVFHSFWNFEASCRFFEGSFERTIERRALFEALKWGNSIKFVKNLIKQKLLNNFTAFYELIQFSFYFQQLEWNRKTWKSCVIWPYNEGPWAPLIRSLSVKMSALSFCTLPNNFEGKPNITRPLDPFMAFYGLIKWVLPDGKEVQRSTFYSTHCNNNNMRESLKEWQSTYVFMAEIS